MSEPPGPGVGPHLGPHFGPQFGPQFGLSVIAPCFDEEGNVELLVRRALAALATLPVPAELVLVDDGSRDATFRHIEAAARAHPERVVARRHEVNRGIVAGWVTGLQAARGELVCLIDSDLQNRPEDIPRLYDAYVASGADVAQAVRRPAANMSRVVFSRGLNHLLNLSFGTRLRDNKSGFVVLSRDKLAALLEDAEGYRYFQSFLGVAAGVRGYRFVEVETPFEHRHAGESFLSDLPVAVSLRILRELARYRLDTLRHPRRR